MMWVLLVDISEEAPSSSKESFSALLESVKELILFAVVSGEGLPESGLSDSLDSPDAGAFEAAPREDWATEPATVITVVEEEVAESRASRLSLLLLWETGSRLIATGDAKMSELELPSRCLGLPP